MQQFPQPHSGRRGRPGRTSPALPSVTLPTSPITTPTKQEWQWSQIPPGKRASALRRVTLQLLFFGLLLALCFWLFYPLPGIVTGPSAANVLFRAVPWLPRFLWTERLPWLVAFISRVSWLSLRSGSSVAVANFALLVLGAAFVLLCLAARACQRMTRDRLLQGRPIRLLLALLCLFTLVFGAIFAFLPAPLVSEQSGPFWRELIVPLSWLTRYSSAFALLAPRALALGLHLLNALLLWQILLKIKPEIRLSATLLYAWNPALLLLGVAEMPGELALIFCLLLAIFLFQQHRLLLGWLSLLLGALTNPLCLLLLPLFLRLLIKETQALAPGKRVLWWLAFPLASVLIVALVCAPFWSGPGIDGLMSNLRQSFWPPVAQASLLSALHELPFASWLPAAWLLTPHHWLLLPALTTGGLLLLGCWIADTLELVLLVGSWVLLAWVILWPVNAPWLILLPLALALASGSRRTAVLAHLLTAGALGAYCLDLWSNPWEGQALITLGLPTLVWGWMLFFVSTWQMAHHSEDEALPPSQQRKRLGLSRPSWPARPTSWPGRAGQDDHSNSSYRGNI